MTKAKKAAQTEAAVNSSAATAAEPDRMSGSLNQADDQALASIVIEGAKQEIRSGFALKLSVLRVDPSRA